MDDKLLIALVAAGGALLGVIVSIFGQRSLHWIKEWPAVRLAARRKALLKQLLEDETWTWRKLNTLASVIGADDSTTKGLLLEIGARGNERGTDMWGLIERNPLIEEQ